MGFRYLGRNPGEIPVETDCEQDVDAALFDVLDLSFRRADSPGRLFRVKHLYGVRLKGHSHGR